MLPMRKTFHQIRPTKSPRTRRAEDRKVESMDPQTRMYEASAVETPVGARSTPILHSPVKTSSANCLASGVVEADMITSMVPADYAQASGQTTQSFLQLTFHFGKPGKIGYSFQHHCLCQSII